MGALYKSGKTLREIAEIYGTSLDSVHASLKRIGISQQDGGRLILAANRKVQRLAQRESICQKRFGCSLEQYRPLRGRITHAFSTQKSHAATRGVGWELTLLEWWDIWEKSGHWNDRGRTGDEYVMCRDGDEGSYAVGNVFIATQRENSYQRVNKNEVHASRRPQKLLRALRHQYFYGGAR